MADSQNISDTTRPSEPVTDEKRDSFPLIDTSTLQKPKLVPERVWNVFKQRVDSAQDKVQQDAPPGVPKEQWDNLQEARKKALKKIADAKGWSAGIDRLYGEFQLNLAEGRQAHMEGKPDPIQAEELVERFEIMLQELNVQQETLERRKQEIPQLLEQRRRDRENAQQQREQAELTVRDLSQREQTLQDELSRTQEALDGRTENRQIDVFEKKLFGRKRKVGEQTVQEHVKGSREELADKKLVIDKIYNKLSDKEKNQMKKDFDKSHGAGRYDLYQSTLQGKLESFIELHRAYKARNLKLPGGAYLLRNSRIEKLTFLISSCEDALQTQDKNTQQENQLTRLQSEMRTTIGQRYVAEQSAKQASEREASLFTEITNLRDEVSTNQSQILNVQRDIRLFQNARDRLSRR